MGKKKWDLTIPKPMYHKYKLNLLLFVFDSINFILLFFSVKHDGDDCTEDCGFELQITLNLCKLGGLNPPPGQVQNGFGDEDSFRDCLQNHLVLDHVSKRIKYPINCNIFLGD